MSTLGENETAYNRLVKATNAAENRLTTPEGSKIFAREQIESKGAGIGTLIDYLASKANKNFYKENAKKILAGKGKEVDVMVSPAYLQKVQNSIKGGTNAGIRQFLLNYFENKDNN